MGSTEWDVLRLKGGTPGVKEAVNGQQTTNRRSSMDHKRSAIKGWHSSQVLIRINLVSKTK